MRFRRTLAAGIAAVMVVAVAPAGAPQTVEAHNDSRHVALDTWTCTRYQNTIRARFGYFAYQTAMHVMAAESNCDHNARNSEGSSATGLFQILRGTWNENIPNNWNWNHSSHAIEPWKNTYVAKKVYDRYGWGAWAVCGSHLTCHDGYRGATTIWGYPRHIIETVYARCGYTWSPSNCANWHFFFNYLAWRNGSSTYVS